MLKKHANTHRYVELHLLIGKSIANYWPPIALQLPYIGEATGSKKTLWFPVRYEV